MINFLAPLLDQGVGLLGCGPYPLDLPWGSLRSRDRLMCKGSGFILSTFWPHDREVRTSPSWPLVTAGLLSGIAGPTVSSLPRVFCPWLAYICTWKPNDLVASTRPGASVVGGAADVRDAGRTCPVGCVLAWVSKRKAADGSARYVANYRDPTDAKRSAGTFRSRAEADRAGHAAEIRIREGSWVDRKAGRVTFTNYVQKSWWPSLQHLELTTRAAYRSNLDAHFLPYFGKYPMSAIAPTVVQGWVATAVQSGLSPRSIRKYHTLLHSIFKAAVRDRFIAYNPCEGSNLPKVVTPAREFISPEQFEKLLLTIPDRDRLLLLVGIETGMRWGELAALRPRHLDWTCRTA